MWARYVDLSPNHEKFIQKHQTSEAATEKCSRLETVAVDEISCVTRRFSAEQRWVRFRTPESTPAGFCVFLSDPVSSEISDLYGISGLLLFLSYFTCQNREIKSSN